MLRRIAPLLLLIAISQSLFSQNSSTRPSISISVGPSFPLDDFGRSDLRDNGSGFAGIGPALNLAYFHPLNKNIGLVLSGSGQMNPINTRKLESEFNDLRFAPSTLSFYSPVLLQPIKYEHWKFEKGSWWAANIMAGIQLSTEPAKNDISFYTRVLFGIAYLSMPEFEGQSQTDTLIASFSQNGSDGFGFSYGFGAGINYSLNTKTYLLANLGWNGTANIKLKEITSTSVTIKNPGDPGNMVVSSQTMTGDGKQTLQALNITFGIGFRL